jgi:hypothetical protein
MAGEADRARRVKALMEKTRSVLPQILDEAQATGDFSKVDRALAATQRLSALGDMAVNTISSKLPDPDNTPNNLMGIVASGANGRDEDSGLGEEMPGNMKADAPTPTSLKPAPLEEETDLPLAKMLRSQHESEKSVTPPPASFSNYGPSSPSEPDDEKTPSIADLADDPAPSAPPEVKPNTGFQVSSREENPSSGEQPATRVDYTKNGNPLTVAAMKAEKDYGGDPAAMVSDLSQHTEGASPSEREFLRRVQMELGERPKMFTIPKVLAALSLGAGSIVGAWMTHRYSGQALMDMDADQKDYDDRKQRIASEVYNRNTALDKANATNAALLARLNLQEAGRDSRAQLSNDTKKSLAGDTNQLKRDLRDQSEQGKTDRAREKFGHEESMMNTREDRKDKRLDKILEAKEKLAKMTEKWHPTDTKVYNTLGAEAHDIWNQLHDKELIWSDEGKKQELQTRLLEINRQMQAIAAKYPSTAVAPTGGP